MKELKGILGQNINITDGIINIELGWDLDKIKQTLS